ncbi:MAG: DUF2162 domain-containing protein [Methanobrevibacter sp.]|jgi:predicted transporter|nr:DUF2162 domain-containing protein [Candidatus Methanoflexus mossambicus]
MDSLNVLWRFGVFAAVMVFGIKIGLATGMAEFSKKSLAVLVALYGLGTYIITLISSAFSTQITDFIYSYNSVFFMIMAVIMIVAGVLTIREYKVHQKNTSKTSAIAILAPCPCCFLSIVVSILLVAPTVGLAANDLSPYVALALMLVIVVSYFLSKTIVRLIKKPFPVVLGSFMLFLGLYFLISALVIPNILAAIGQSMGSITIENTNYILYVIIVLAILIIGGVFLTRRNGLLNK